MANTLSVMSNVLRNAVSKQRIRYKENGYNLDLSYIYDNIIAMGYPAPDKLEGFYRNRLEDVYKFLEQNHPDHYKIYNLCLERNYDIEKFHGRVAIYPFEDHNPPTIELILRFCADVDTWLKTDSRNVVAVHCKAGKGRTGTMICCYLLYSGFQVTAEAALAWYDEKRTKDRKGVTIPSQRRYVQYFSTLISSGETYEKLTLRLCEIRFSETSFLSNQGNLNCSVSVLQDSATTQKVEVQRLKNWTIDFHKSFILDIKNSSLTVAGDIKVELSLKSARKTFFHFWFNTYFVPEIATREGEGSDAKFIYTLNKHEIDDAHKDKDHKNYSEDFKVQLVFFVENSTGNTIGDGCNSPVYLNSSSEYDMSYSEQSGGCASNNHVDAINGLIVDDKTQALNNCQQFKLNIHNSTQGQPIRTPHMQPQPFLSNADAINLTPKRKQSKLKMNATKSSDEIILTAEIHNESINFQPSTLQSSYSTEYQYDGYGNQQQKQSVKGGNHPLRQDSTNINEQGTTFLTTTATTYSRTCSSNQYMKVDDIFSDCDSRSTASFSKVQQQQELPQSSTLKAHSNLNLPLSNKRKTEALNAKYNGGELINCFEDQRATSMDKNRLMNQKSKTQDSISWLGVGCSSSSGGDWKKKEKFMPISIKFNSAKNNPPPIVNEYKDTTDASSHNEARKFMSENETNENTTGNFVGLNTSGNVKIPNSSKQKLKTKFKKNKLKFSQKLQWFQNYFHSDPSEFKQNFVKHTELRRNSTSSLVGRSNKVQIANLSGSSTKSINNQMLSTSCPNDSTKLIASQQKVKLTKKLSKSYPQIHKVKKESNTKEFCDDFYSLICEKQLSFNNSPSKSPRSFLENATIVTRSSKLFLPQQEQYRNERSIGGGGGVVVKASSPSTNDKNSIVIVAAKPAKTELIGFKVDQRSPPDGVRKTDYLGNLEAMDNDDDNIKFNRNPYKMDDLQDTLSTINTTPTTTATTTTKTNITITKSPGQMIIDSDNCNTNMTNGNYYVTCTKLNCSGCSDCAATSMMHLKKTPPPATTSSMMCVVANQNKNQSTTDMNCKQTFEKSSSVSPENT